MGIDSFFSISARKSTIRKEIFAGLVTFITMAYAIVLIPSILAEAGLEFGSVMMATLLTAAFATLVMGFYANYPFVIAPGLALAIYFAYTINQHEQITWQMGLSVVFVTGVLFLILNLLKVRKLIVESIPACLRIGIIGGLGLFLAIIGLKNAQILVSSSRTVFALQHPFTLNTAFALLGLATIGILMSLRVIGAIFWGIVVVWALAFFFGYVEWQGFVSWPKSMSPTFLQLDFRHLFTPAVFNMWVVFVFVALFDSTGTIAGLGAETGLVMQRGNKGCFPNVSRALFPDATGSILSSLLGSTTCAVYIESATAVTIGAKTGLCAIVVGLLFLLSIFFIPFAASIPLFATAPALIIVGGMMLRGIAKLNWQEPAEWISAFVTLIVIALSLSIANGIAAGYIIYCVLKLVTGKVRGVHPLCWILATLFLLKFIFLPL